MATATESPTAAAVATPAQSGPPDLWAGMELEVIGGTGEFGTGKTLFGLSIDPGPRTLVYDNEGSATAYKRIGFDHVDVAKELLKVFPVHQYPKGPSTKDRFLWWLADHRRRIASGNYTVVMVDPISEIESGLAKYVQENPAEFGYSAEQFRKSSGLYWGAVKDYQKSILDQIRASGIKTFYFTVHMRDEWRGNAPTGKREAKGKETLFELASLYLQFDRPLNSEGKRPEVPSAIVLKSRLAHTGFDERGGLITKAILPPNLPEATPAAIREYIKKPANYSRLKESERVHERQLSEDEKLQIKAQTAADERAAAEANASRFETLRTAAMAQGQAAAAVPQAPDQAGQRAVAITERAADRAAPTANGEAVAEVAPVPVAARRTFDQSQRTSMDPNTAKCFPEQLRAIRRSFEELVRLGVMKWDDVSPKLQSVLKALGRSTFDQMSYAEAEDLEAKLQAAIAKAVIGGDGQGPDQYQPLPTEGTASKN